MASKLKYIGGGFIAGVPARDLSAEEAAQYGEKELLASGLYVREDDHPAEKPAKKSKED
jgi:hypothetical protein